jgi:hypothetical protein
MNDLAQLKNRSAIVGVGNTRYDSLPEIDGLLVLA